MHKINKAVRRVIEVSTVVMKDEEEDSESDLPLIASKPAKKQQLEEKKKAKKPVEPESEEEQDTPVVKPKAKLVKTDNGAAKKVVPEKKKLTQPVSSEQSEEQEPLKKTVAKVKSPVQKPLPKKKPVEPEEESNSEEVKPVKKVSKSPIQKAVVPKKKLVQPSSEEEEQEEEQKPVKKIKSPVNAPIAKKSKPKQPEPEEESEEQETVPKQKTSKLVFQQKVAVTKKPAPVAQPSEDDESEESQQPKPKAKKTVPVVQAKPVQKKPVKPIEPESQEEEEEEEEEQKPKQTQPVRKGSKDLPVASKPNKIVAEDEDGQFEVCVQGLSYEAFDSDIQEFFEPCGNIISVRLITRPDGKSKGTAFVKFSKKSSFLAACQLSGSEHKGRNLKIEQAIKRDNAGGYNKGGNNNFKPNNFNKGGPVQSNADIQTPTLFIGGLSYNSTVESICQFFQQAAQVQNARIVTDRETGKPRGFGYVEFRDVEAAKKAYKELNGASLDGRNIRLDSAAQRERPQGGQGGYGGQGGQGGFNRGPPRNPGNSVVNLNQDDKNARKGAIGTFQGKRVLL